MAFPSSRSSNGREVQPWRTELAVNRVVPAPVFAIYSLPSGGIYGSLTVEKNSSFRNMTHVLFFLLLGDDFQVVEACMST